MTEQDDASELRRQVAQASGVPEHFLTGTTRHEIETSATQILTWFEGTPEGQRKIRQKSLAEAIKRRTDAKEAAPQRAIEALGRIHTSRQIYG